MVRLRMKFRCLKMDFLKRAFELQLGETCLAYCGKLMDIQDLPYVRCQENHASSSQFPSKPSLKWEELDLHPRSIPKSIKTILTHQHISSCILHHILVSSFCNPVLESGERMRVLIVGKKPWIDRPVIVSLQYAIEAPCDANGWREPDTTGFQLLERNSTIFTSLQIPQALCQTLVLIIISQIISELKHGKDFRHVEVILEELCWISYKMTEGGGSGFPLRPGLFVKACF